MHWLESRQRIPHLRFSPDGTVLAGADPYGIQLWQTSTGKQVRHLALDVQREVHALGFSADGGAVTVVYNRGSIRTWDVAKGTELPSPWKLERRGILPIVAISPDGKVLATTEGFEAARVAVVGGQEHRFPLARRDGCQLPSLAIAADGKSFVAATRVATCVWETATGKELGRFSTGYYRAPRTLALSPDGKVLASPGNSSEGYPWVAERRFALKDKEEFFVRLRDALTGRELGRIPLPAPAPRRGARREADLRSERQDAGRRARRQHSHLERVARPRMT